MKKLAFLFSLLLTFGAKAQVIIPHATQQPKWGFPIYFEDSIGQKDTVYFGYSPNATNSITNPDKNLGEFFQSKDTNMLAYMTDCYCWPGIDSIVKVDIRDTSNINQYNYFRLTVTGVYPPLKIKWNPNVLYSDSTPYPYQFPAPRAQIELRTNYFYNLPPCPLFGNEDILVTDSVQANCQLGCNYSDSLYFNHASPAKSNFYFDMLFFPWYGCALNPAGIEVVNKPEAITVFPNPTAEIIQFRSQYQIIKAEVLTMDGILEKKIILNGEREFSTKALAEGIYFIKFYLLNNTFYTQKIVINHF